MDDLPDGVLSPEGHAQRIKPRLPVRGDRVRVVGPDEPVYLGVVASVDGQDCAFVYDSRLNVVAHVPLAWVQVVERATAACPTCGREVTP